MVAIMLERANLGSLYGGRAKLGELGACLCDLLISWTTIGFWSVLRAFDGGYWWETAGTSWLSVRQLALTLDLLLDERPVILLGIIRFQYTVQLANAARRGGNGGDHDDGVNQLALHLMRISTNPNSSACLPRQSSYFWKDGNEEKSIKRGVFSVNWAPETWQTNWH